MATSTLTPMVLNNIQSGVISHFSGAFTQLSGYAADLFYILAVMEIVLFGLWWAIRQEALWAGLFFKIIKLGVIFLIIRYYPYLIQTLINGFTDVAFHHAKGVSDLFFNPGKIWKYGFDNSLVMLKLSIQYGSPNVSLALLYLVLGLGTLIMFALIGAEIIVVTAGFYIVSLVALLLIPFGTLTVAKNFMEQAISGVFQMGARMFALIMVLGIGVTVWSSMTLQVDQNTTIDQLLGFFFMTLVILVLSLKVPKLTAMAVGKVGGTFGEMGESSGAEVSVSSSATMTSAAMSMGPNAVSVSANTAGSAAAVSNPLSAIQAASAVGAAGAGTGNAAATTVVSGSTTGGEMFGGESKVGQGTDVVRGLSPETINKLKHSFKQVLRENTREK